ncbi:MAG: DUF1599 domain-containing protein [Adhaeribacter sp.]
MINQTLQEYNRVIAACRETFLKKTQDYGTAWRILRLPSLTDQIFIKAQRIRSIQEKGVQKVAEDISGEFVGIVNYCLIALMQLHLDEKDGLEIPADTVAQWYDREIAANIELLENKNHDYGEAWRDMRISSITDIILMKLYRTKQIEDNQGQTLVSEGVEANYRDMINYAVFCLIKLNYGTHEAH